MRLKSLDILVFEKITVGKAYHLSIFETHVFESSPLGQGLKEKCVDSLVCLRPSCLITFSSGSRPEGEVRGQPGLRDADPQGDDAALHQPAAEAPSHHPVWAQWHGEVVPHHAPRRVPGGAQRPRGRRRHRGHLQHAPPVLQGEPPANHNLRGAGGSQGM